MQNTHDARLVAMIRDRFKETPCVKTATAANILAAYAAWHVMDGQNWEHFPPMLNGAKRRAVWNMWRHIHWQTGRSGEHGA